MSKQGLQVKTCKWCGEQFETASPNAKYCNRKHYKKCIVCNRMFEVSMDQIQNRTETCSNECRIKLSTLRSISDESGNYLDFVQDPAKWLSIHYNNVKPTYKQLCDDLGVASSTIQQALARRGVIDAVDKYVSVMEQEVIEFILSIRSNTTIVKNDRKLIHPMELDIYLPEFRIAIECNPTYTHNSSYDSFSEHPKATTYHKNKTDMCEKQGIRLIHIFGYEWVHKRVIIQSIICNAIGCNTCKIYARKCDIREVSYNTAAIFLNNNHRQGNTISLYRFGLYFDDELVALMTFSHCRTGATNVVGSSHDFELVRFCNKLNTTVVGGASKLFKYFISNYECDSIISYSDRAHTSGGIYTKLGFKQMSISDPGYVWVHLNTQTAYNRVNAQKRNISKFLNDTNIDITKSENDIMIEHGYVKVYDSGTIKWIYYKESE